MNALVTEIGLAIFVGGVLLIAAIIFKDIWSL